MQPLPSAPVRPRPDCARSPAPAQAGLGRGRRTGTVEEWPPIELSGPCDGEAGVLR